MNSKNFSEMFWYLWESIGFTYGLMILDQVRRWMKARADFEEANVEAIKVDTEIRRGRLK